MPERPRLRWKRLIGFTAGALVWSLSMATWQTAQEERHKQPAERWEYLKATFRKNDLPVFGPWSQVGPFHPNLRKQQGPDDDAGADRVYQLLDGKSGKWQPRLDYLDGYVNEIATDGIGKTVLDNQPTIYLVRDVTSPRAMTIKLFLGCGGGFAMWLDGKPVTYVPAIENFQPGQEVATLPLRKGKNRLLMKVRLTSQPCRFFFVPDFGAERNRQMLADVDQRYPSGRGPVTDYRTRAAVLSADAEQAHYPMVEIPTPEDVFIEGGGMDFLSDGRLAVSTRRGFVYLVENAGGDPGQIKFQRYAAGLHEGFGLKVVDGDILVVERGRLTRLVDTDHDDRADRFENLGSDWGLTGAYHEYAYGLEQDDEGNFYVSLNTSSKNGPLDETASPVPYRGCVVRITPDGETEPFCYGFRSPNGMGQNAVGDIFVTDNQGQWVPASPVYHIRQDHYYGHPAGLRWADDAQPDGSSTFVDRTPTPPAVWIPYEELSMSASDIVCDQTGGRFGPFSEQLFVGDMTKGVIIRVALERVAGEYQGACMLFRRGCGAVNRMAFGPDGNLYFSRVNRGWGGGGRGDGLARIEYSGSRPLEMHTVNLQSDGFLVTFTKPLALQSKPEPGEIRLEQFGYHRWREYGSPKIDREFLPVSAVEVAADRFSLRIRTSGLKTGRICRITLPRLDSATGDSLLHVDAYYTINALSE